MSKPKLYNVRVSGEGGEEVIMLNKPDMQLIQRLLREYVETGDWDDMINELIDNAPKIECVGTINTCGDGGGWYDADGNRLGDEV